MVVSSDSLSDESDEDDPLLSDGEGIGRVVSDSLSEDAREEWLSLGSE